MNADKYIACAANLAKRAKSAEQLKASLEQLYSCIVKEARHDIPSRRMRNVILDQIREEILEVV